jgi:hypothetical protein
MALPTSSFTLVENSLVSLIQKNQQLVCFATATFGAITACKQKEIKKGMQKRACLI